MYAIIADGGRQYKVEEGEELDVDLREVTAGDELTFDRVLACRTDEGIQVGKPTVDGAHVTAEVVGVKLGKKVVVQKFRKRKNYRRKTGHRQLFTRVRINKIHGLTALSILLFGFVRKRLRTNAPRIALITRMENECSLAHHNESSIRVIRGFLEY